MAIYKGISGTNREIKKQYRGIGGTNREIKEQWRGIGGTNRKVFSSNDLVFIKGAENLGSGGYVNIINGGAGYTLYTGSTSVANLNTNEFIYKPPSSTTGTLILNFGGTMNGYVSVVCYNSGGSAVFNTGSYPSINTSKTYNITTAFTRLRIATDSPNKTIIVNSATWNGQPVEFALS